MIFSLKRVRKSGDSPQQSRSTQSPLTPFKGAKPPSKARRGLILPLINESETHMLHEFEIDQSEVVDGIPEGEYKVNVVDAELKTSKAGNPYARWQFTVIDNADPRYNGQAIWHSTPTTGKGAFRLLQLYRAAVGAKLDKNSTKIDPKAILGKQLRITVVNSHDQDGNLNGFSEVKTVRPV